MSARKDSVLIAIISVLAANELVGQSSPRAVVPLKELAPPTAVTTERFGSVLSVRALSDGKLLVNDFRRRQLILLDQRLQRTKIVLDSAASTSQSYGTYAPIIPYLGDSTLIVDIGAVSLSVIEPDGTIGRVLAPPVPSEWKNLSLQGAAHDAKGNLIFRLLEKSLSTATDDTAHLRKAFSRSDSFLVVRANFETQRFDTLGRVHSPLGGAATIAIEGNRTIITIFDDPLPTYDDYAVLSDGTVAFVRGHDYHVDLIAPTGERIKGPKLPFDWRRLSDKDKQALIDSAEAKAARDEAERIAAASKRSSTATPTTARAEALRQQAADRRERVFKAAKLTAEKIADFYPPIRPSAAKPDMNGALWILPTTSAQSKSGELVYDVVNNRGQLLYRVRIPLGRSIAGFGKNGEVYLMSRDSGGWTLERTFIRE